MRIYTGRVAEIQLDRRGTSAKIACPKQAIPAPGQYLLATDPDAILGTPLFYAGEWEGGFLAAPPIPASWAPGTLLSLRGRLGRGFRLPAQLQRLGLVAAGESPARLLPLATSALAQDTAVTLFCETPLPPLPTSLEAYPLSALPEMLAWADYLCVDLSMESLPRLRDLLGLSSGSYLPCPGQALILAPMPCGSLADCGVCAVRLRRSWKWACQDGPVFDLKELLT